MIRIFHFFGLLRKRLPISRCWQISGMPYIAKKAADIAAFVVLVGGFLYLTSEHANSSGVAASNQSAATIQQQAEVIAGMSKILDACLSDSTGKPVTINGQIFLCGIVQIGEHKNGK